MSLDRLFGLEPRPSESRPFQAPQAGSVVRVTATGELFVTLETLGDDVEIGPCRYSRPDVHTHPTGSTTTGANAGAYPPAGTRVLVLFAEGEQMELDPWLVAFDGWPA